MSKVVYGSRASEAYASRARRARASRASEGHPSEDGGPYAARLREARASRASDAYPPLGSSRYGSRASEAGGAPYQASSAGAGFQTAEDIIPIAELKTNMSEIVRGLDERPRPLVITLNGKPAAVVMSPREYDRLSYQSRFVDAVAAGLADVRAGRTFDGEQAVSELLTELGHKPEPGHKKPRRSRAR